MSETRGPMIEMEYTITRLPTSQSIVGPSNNWPKPRTPGLCWCNLKLVAPNMEKTVLNSTSELADPVPFERPSHGMIV